MLSAFALVAAGPGADEHDGVCLLAGDEMVSPDITQRRRAAEERARYYLDGENEFSITHRMAWDVLSLWSCRSSIRRKAVRPEGVDHIKSDTLGLARKQDVSGPAGLRVGRTSLDFPGSSHSSTSTYILC